MTTECKSLAVAKVCVAVLVAGFLCGGCMPIDITKTFKISTSADVFQAVAGTPIPDGFELPAVDICSEIPEEYRDVNELIRQLLADAGMEVLANFIHIDSLDLVGIQFRIVEDGGSFDGITEVSATLNDEAVLLATPGSGISADEIDLTPDEPIGLLDLLQTCPTFSAAIKGTVPDPPPTKWDNYVTLRLQAYLGYRPSSD